MTQVALPELRRYGYSGALATGTLAAGGTLGVLIPPSGSSWSSNAILTEQNIARLFVAAFVPGILAAIGYMITVAIYVRISPGSAGTRGTRALFGALQGAGGNLAGAARPSSSSSAASMPAGSRRRRVRRSARRAPESSRSSMAG